MSTAIIGAFSSIVGLIGQFKSERSATEQADFNKFIEWLIENNHEEIKFLINTNIKTSVSIKALLKQSHEEFYEKFYQIEKGMLSLASKMDGFGQLAESINPQAVLSDQALNILIDFENSGASEMLQLPDSVEEFLYLDSPAGNQGPRITDSRFLKDDMGKLVEMGFLRVRYNSRDEEIYIYTRLASEFVKAKRDL